MDEPARFAKGSARVDEGRQIGGQHQAVLGRPGYSPKRCWVHSLGWWVMGEMEDRGTKALRREGLAIRTLQKQKLKNKRRKGEMMVGYMAMKMMKIFDEDEDYLLDLRQFEGVPVHPMTVPQVPHEPRGNEG